MLHVYGRSHILLPVYRGDYFYDGWNETISVGRYWTNINEKASMLIDERPSVIDVLKSYAPW